MGQAIARCKFFVFRRKDSDRRKSHLPRGPCDAHGDFAAIRDQQALHLFEPPAQR